MTGKQPIKIAAIGAGNRMGIYAEYALLHPGQMRVVAVAEPNTIRRGQFASRFGIEDKNCFASWQDFFNSPRIADAVFICTPDNLHFEPTMLALENDYDILLEKPIAQSWKECSEIVAKSRERNKIVGVCHVLRYHPYFKKLKELINNGNLGRLLSVNHVEAVGIERMTHAFVRGLWRKESETNPMILSKACHDLDLLVWLTGKNCRKVSSYGSLAWFKKENAPAGSTERCTGGCAVEKECPYSAVDLYYRRKRWLRHFDMPEDTDSDSVILHELQTGPYGRCVYHCDNDVVDHQIVSMLMEDEITINFSMDAFTKESGRKTHFMFSEAEVYGNERRLTVRFFLPGKPDEVYDFSDYSGECNFHGGADLNIVEDFIKAVRERNGNNLLTNIESSLESHRIAFEIEKVRVKDNII